MKSPTPQSPARTIALSLAVLAVFEVLALGPSSSWVLPRIWWTQMLVTAAAGVLIWIVSVVLGSIARKVVGAKYERSDVALTLIVLVFSAIHLRALLSPFKSLLLLALLLLYLAAIHYLGRQWKIGRQGRWAWQMSVPLLAIGVTALSNGELATGVPEIVPWLPAVGYLVAVALLTRKLGDRAPAPSLALAAVFLLALRLVTVNPHDLHLRGEQSERLSEAGPPTLLIVLDTLRGDALDLDDPATSETPNLARFAQSSDRYTRAIANASWTVPGHASIFTGLRLSQHRLDITNVPGFRPSLGPETPTMAELFAGSGYLTSCIAANALIRSENHLDRGFRRWRNPGHSWFLSTFGINLFATVTPYYLPELTQLLVDLTGLGRWARAEEMVDLALAELESTPGSLFLFLNFMDAHRPFGAPEGTGLGTRLTFWRDHFKLLTGHRPEGDEREEHVSTSLAYYAAQVKYLDGELGRLFEELEASGLLDRMNIVVTADHGEAFLENETLTNYFGHSGAYEPVVRIPLIVRRPGQRVGRVLDHAVQQTDLLPSLLQLAGLPTLDYMTPGLQSVDPERIAVTEWYPRANDRGSAHLPWQRLAAYSGDLKLVQEKGGEQLLDLAASPWETVDVLGERPEVGERLSRALDDLTVVLDVGDEHEIDPELERQLRALGYIN